MKTNWIDRFAKMDLFDAVQTIQEDWSTLSALIHEAETVRNTQAFRVPGAVPDCADDVCQAAKHDGVLCAEDECDFHSGVRKPPPEGAAPLPAPREAVRVLEEAEAGARVLVANDAWGQHHAVRIATVVLDALAALRAEGEGDCDD